MIDMEKCDGPRHNLKIDQSYTFEGVKVKTLSNCKHAQSAPMGKSHRISSDSAWPLRNSQGLTFAEAKRRKEQEQSK